MTPLTLRANVVYCCKGSCVKTQSYISKTKRHLAIKVQEHLSGKSGKSAIHEHISSCKDCYSCYISNFYTLAQSNTDIISSFKIIMISSQKIQSLRDIPIIDKTLMVM